MPPRNRTEALSSLGLRRGVKCSAADVSDCDGQRESAPFSFDNRISHSLRKRVTMPLAQLRRPSHVDRVQSGDPRFSVGQVVHHQLFGYRGVVIGVHAQFQGDDDWYDRVARSRPPKDQPWYEVLPHDSVHQTYVAQRNLTADTSGRPVRHPLLGVFFREFDGRRYRVGGMIN